MHTEQTDPRRRRTCATSRGVHMSAGHLSREFRLAYGEPPYTYLMTRRIERAMALLRRGETGHQTDQESRSPVTERHLA